MPTIQDIRRLRYEGKIEASFNECKALWGQYPEDRHARVEMAWCIKSMCEKAVKTRNVNAFIEAFSLLPKLRLKEIGEISMSNRFSWEIKSMFDTLVGDPQTLTNTADRILEILKRLEFNRPDKYYTMLADVYLKVKGRQNTIWTGFAAFMDWFGFEHLRPEDYSRIPLSNGKSILSVGERVHIAYYKALKAEIEVGNIDNDKINSFLGELDTLQRIHPEFQYTLYHRSLLLLSLNRKAEALESVRPFVRRKQGEFWVWDVLASTTDDKEIQLSCYCRALLCRTEPKYLGRVQIKTVKLMHELGFEDNARTELQKMISTYKENGWRMPGEANDMTREPWYQIASILVSNKPFYEEHLEKSEEFLFLDTPETAILITRYDSEKRICNFITEHKERGFFSTRRIKGKFRQNCIYKVRFEGQMLQDSISTILTYKGVNDVARYIGIFFKKIDGRLKRRADYAFVEDVYVDGKLLAAISPDVSLVQGTAVLSFNPKKSEYSWRAIVLKGKD